MATATRRPQLYAPDLLATGGNAVARFDTKAAALKEHRWANLGPEVAPVKVMTRFSYYWALWAVPVGDPGEAKTLWTRERGWVKVCAVGCRQLAPTIRTCSGHPMTPAESREYTVAVCGHRTRVARVLTDRRVDRTDGTYDYVPAGAVYAPVCLCGWKPGRTEARRWAVQQADEHAAAYAPAQTPAVA